jgi:uncharacterized paraquat-inducible protein A
MTQGKSKVTYGKEWYEILIINGANFLNIISGNNRRYFVSEQCQHVITTKTNERPEFCSRCGIGLDWNYFSTHKECPRCQREYYNPLDQICGYCKPATRLIAGFRKV